MLRGGKNIPVIQRPKGLFFSIWPYRIIRWGLGLLFVYAAAGKFTDPQEFSEVIGAFGLLPETLLHPAAVVLPFLEVVAGVGLLLDIRGSLAVYAGLLSVFGMVVGYGIRLGLDIDCGCFGPNDPFSEVLGLRGTLYRILLLLGFCAYLHIWRRACSFTPIGMTDFFKRMTAREGSRKNCEE